MARIKCGYSCTHLVQMRNIFLRLVVIGMICSWVLPDSQLGMRKRWTTRKLCGPYLSGALRLVCNGTYNEWKRNGDSIQLKQAQGTAVNSGRIFFFFLEVCYFLHTRVETLIVATIYLQLIQNRYMFRSFTVLQCSHQYCVEPVASDVEVVGYL